MNARRRLTARLHNHHIAAAALSVPIFGFSAGPMRRWHLVLLALAFVIAAMFVSPLLIRNARQRQFDAAQRIVQSHGGRLSFDLVDGNYMLDLSDLPRLIPQFGH